MFPCITSILPRCADGFPSESFHCHMLIPRAISLPFPDRSRTTTHQKPRWRMWDASVFLIPLCENTFLSGRRRATESVCIQMVFIKYFMLGLWHCPMGPLVSRDLFVYLFPIVHQVTKLCPFSLLSAVIIFVEVTAYRD